MSEGCQGGSPNGPLCGFWVLSLGEPKRNKTRGGPGKKTKAGTHQRVQKVLFFPACKGNHLFKRPGGNEKGPLGG